jgi:hypothetical protein
MASVNSWHPSVVNKDKGGENMSKKKNKDLQHNNAMPKTDVEFAQDGLEKVALKAQERKK